MDEHAKPDIGNSLVIQNSSGAGLVSSLPPHENGDVIVCPGSLFSHL